MTEASETEYLNSTVGNKAETPLPLHSKSKTHSTDRKVVDPLHDFWSTPIPSRQTGILCTVCQQLFSQNSRWHEKEWYAPFEDRLSSFTKHCRPFRTLGDLCRSADAGCQLCTSLRLSLMRRGYEFPSKIKSQYSGQTGHSRVHSRSFGDLDDGIQLLVFCGHSKLTPFAEITFSVMVFAQSEDPGYLYCMVTTKLEESSERVGRYSAAGNRISNKAPLEWMKARLQACVEGHDQCGAVSPLRRLLGFEKCPKRLLDLCRCDVDQVVQLVESEDLRKLVPYATVSHKWASEPRGELLLTKDVETALRKGCPMSHLPLLFQDIVRLTWKLGLQYLWVDTLCIKQDDEADWAFHAEDMSNVYAFATVSLCVGSALHHQNLMFPGRSTLPYDDGCIIPTWTRFSARSLTINGHLLLTVLSEDEPLFGRGWVFQERMLAPRILHFGKEQVFWRCRESSSAELTTSIGSEQGVINGPQMSLASLFGTRKLDAPKLLGWWCTTVAEYSRTATTYERDRLHAIGGIASMLQRQLWHRLVSMPVGTQYAAGMWTYNLCFQLSWYSLNERRPRPNKSSVWYATDHLALSESQIDQAMQPRPREYRAPSWSWASVSTPVTFYLQRQNLIRHEYLIEIPNEGIGIEADGTMFGPCMPGATLRVRCNLCKAFLKPEVSAKDGFSVHVTFVKGGECAYATTTTLWKVTDLWARAMGVSWDDPSYETIWRENKRSLFYVLPLSMSAGSGDWGNLGRRRESINASRTPGRTASQLKSVSAGRSQLYLSNVDFELRERWKLERSFFFNLCTLLLEPVPHEPGRYKRVGLMSFRNSWNAKYDDPKAASIMNAFRQSGLTIEAGQILGHPDSLDASVYEIELL